MEFILSRLARSLGRFEKAVDRVRQAADADWAAAVLADGPGRAGARAGDIVRMAYALDIAASVLTTVPGAVKNLQALVEAEFGEEEEEMKP